jgi:hypothetical protein
VTPLAGKTRSKAFIDVAIGHEDPKRIVVELAVGDLSLPGLILVTKPYLYMIHSSG